IGFAGGGGGVGDGGGGGGAGYGAGAGGFGQDVLVPPSRIFSAGGGGSSHVFDPSASNVSSITSQRTGTSDGQVTITFDPTTDSCPVTPAAVIPTAAFTG
ncbi:MAG TPA: hypothetical protein VIX84_08880, partial [Acidimicrobiales bacterium]